MDTYSFPVEWDLSFINTFNSFVFQHPTQVSWFVIRPCLFANWHPSKLRLLSSWRNWDIGVLSETEIQEFYLPWWLHLSGMAPWFFFKKNICIYLAVPGLSCGMRDLWSFLQPAGSFYLWHMNSKLWHVPWPGMEPRHSKLGARHLNHWTTRKIVAPGK